MQNAERMNWVCQLPHATSLQQVCDLTYQITGNPAFVSDMAHTILAYTRCVEISDHNWQTNVVGAILDRNTLVQGREVDFVHDSSTGNQRPVLVRDANMPYPRYIKTLVWKGTPVGVMVVTAYLRPFQKEDAELIELIASFLVPLMTKERYFMSGDPRTAENYFIQLLEGVHYSRERVEKRLAVLEFQQADYMYVLTICARDRKDEGQNQTLSQLMGKFRQLGCCNVFLYNATLVAVYGSNSDIADWDKEEALTQLLRAEELVAGISRQITGLEHLREFYCQARDALKIGLKLQRVDTCYFRYDSLSAFLLFQNTPPEDLMRYCHQKIQTLGEYDRTHHMDLRITLQVYLEQAKSLAKAAEILFIHRNTVRYRINKCMELMNTDLEDGNEIFAYILSLRILEYQAKFQPKEENHPAWQDS